jgi:branched-subunit amino acid aminotransferase/4-amino-4-deoxychorismate lyase
MQRQGRVAELIAYFNGRMVPASEARLPVYDAGVVQGATVAEQTRTFRGKLFRLDAHLDRLFRSLEYARIEIELNREKLRSISEELVAHNCAALDAGEDLGLIHFITAGPYATYACMAAPPAAGPTVCVHTFPLPFKLWAAKFLTGAHLVTSSFRHVPPQCSDPHMKHRSRIHFYLADKEVRQQDPEAIALLLDLNGNVTETNGANFLMVERGTIVSPTLRNILAGISRAMVIELAARLGVPFVERDVDVPAALSAEEAFLASTPYCLMPVTRINGVTIGSGLPGAVFQRLIAAWSTDVGLDITHQILDGARRRGAVE